MSLPVTLDGVSRHFGGIRAVEDVSMDVAAGSITGLIGPNGAGKTTVFNLVSRVLDPTAGRVLIDGNDVTGTPMVACAALGVARTFQTPRGFGSLTVAENVEVAYASRGEGVLGALLLRRRREQRDRAEAVLERVGLAGLRDTAYLALSGGQRRMVEIARQIAREPRLLLLDEPTAGLDVEHQETLRSLLLSLREQGMTVLLVEHNLRFLLRTVEMVHVMTAGRLVTSGTPDRISADERVIAAYLGRGAGHAATGT